MRGPRFLEVVERSMGPGAVPFAVEGVEVLGARAVWREPVPSEDSGSVGALCDCPT